MFVPLSGKSLDMLWLCAQGMTVVGNDIVEKAAVDFFLENRIPFNNCKCIHYSVSHHYTCPFHFLAPTNTTVTDKHGPFTVYEAADRQIKFLVGDIFDCTPEVVGVYDCIWETNALIALNPEDREKYARTLAALTKPGGRMLMSTYEYDQSLRSTFPLSMPLSKVEELFQAYYIVKLQEKEDLIGKEFTRKFNLPWAFRNIILMERKREY